MKTLGLATLQDKLPGALFCLMPHQVLGVAFMVKREESAKAPFGGLLCDAMGEPCLPPLHPIRLTRHRSG